MVRKIEKEPWPSREDIEKGKEFEKNHPAITGVFEKILWFLLNVIADFLLALTWPIRFLRRIKVLGSRNNKGLDRCLVVCWSDFWSEGHVFSSFSRDYYHWYELGFDMPTKNKTELAKKILERVQNLRTNRGPGNERPDSEVRVLEKRDQMFLVSIESDERILFSRFLGNLKGRIGVYMTEETDKGCLLAIERVLKEPPDPKDDMWANSKKEKGSKGRI